jgi:hypothetical protein
MMALDICSSNSTGGICNVCHDDVPNKYLYRAICTICNVRKYYCIGHGNRCYDCDIDACVECTIYCWVCRDVRCASCHSVHKCRMSPFVMIDIRGTLL